MYLGDSDPKKIKKAMMRTADRIGIRMVSLEPFAGVEIISDGNCLSRLDIDSLADRNVFGWQLYFNFMVTGFVLTGNGRIADSLRVDQNGSPWVSFNSNVAFAAGSRCFIVTRIRSCRLLWGICR